MTYATEQDLIDRFGSDELAELTDRADPPTGVADSTVVASALEDADELIDSYIAKRYDLPLASSPPRLVKLACDIARFFLYKDDPTEAVESVYKASVAFLRDVSAGRAVLDIAGAEPAPAGDTVQVSGPDRVFTSETLDGF